ncbi:MAG: dihydroorotate dehydrogenase electron transfer subunit [Oscillospiraceae bacterium]|nr:dihydroorotate dehydrogenase electron transfer subunit [Oscillospiraceae bacterium]
MRLAGEGKAKPGQFVNIMLGGLFLRRPISVCDAAEGEFTIIYKVVGRGTELLATYPTGKVLDVLTGLGNGYDINLDIMRPLLVGGGVGSPPLYLLAKRLFELGKTPRVVLGFNTASEIILENEFRDLGLEVNITTIDGSRGTRGFVTDAIGCLSGVEGAKEGFAGAVEGAEGTGDFDYVFACGPEAMLRAVYDATQVDGQFSFEERMGCGFGACMGCSCKTRYGYKRICTEGPVLKRGEIIW